MSTLTHKSIQEGRKILRANALEDEVQSAIEEYLFIQKVPHTITNAKEAYSRYGRRIEVVEEGWPDVTCVEPGTGDGHPSWGGKLLAIECKRAEGGVLEYEQAICLQMLWEAKAIIVIARSIDDVIEARRTSRPTQSMINEILTAIAKGPNLKKKQRRAAERIQRTRRRR